MIKFHISIVLVLGMFLTTYGQFSQNPLSQNGQPELQMTRVEKGQTLNDVLPDMWQSRTQTDIDPGISQDTLKTMGNNLSLLSKTEIWNHQHY